MLNKGQSRGKPRGDESILVGYSEESKAYRFWKPSTTVKARNVKFFEEIDCPRGSPQEILHVSYLNMESSNEKGESSNEDDEEG